MTLPVVLFVCTQSSSVLCTVMLVGAGVDICICGIIVVMWLDVRMCPFRCLDLVLYLFPGVTLKVITSYG